MRGIKVLLVGVQVLIAATLFAQKPPPLPHGMVFGIKPAGIGPTNATTIESDMQRKTRVTAALRGRIIKVTKPKGGWFEMDGGNGRIIQAHFKDYNILLPTALRGRIVIIQGVALKQFIADDLQHFAGDTVSGKKQHKVNTSASHRINFEVTGLIVDE
ncbi:DUF4920 domain-containing protein [Mucilaginibacter terrenus]|nr:DUF4920 domain-containing protein [Mucilaginibacter terrenus]